MLDCEPSRGGADTMISWEAFLGAARRVLGQILFGEKFIPGRSGHNMHVLASGRPQLPRAIIRRLSTSSQSTEWPSLTISGYDRAAAEERDRLEQLRQIDNWLVMHGFVRPGGNRDMDATPCWSEFTDVVRREFPDKGIARLQDSATSVGSAALPPLIDSRPAPPFAYVQNILEYCKVNLPRARPGEYTDIQLARWITAKLEDSAHAAAIAPPAQCGTDIQLARWIAARLADGEPVGEMELSARRELGELATVPQPRDRGGRPIKYDRDGFLGSAESRGPCVRTRAPEARIHVLRHAREGR
jgi:hypothetical protein